MVQARKVTLKLVRSFGFGVVIHSPKLNGLCFDIQIACFVLAFWNRGRGLFGFEDYWNG